MCEHKKLKFNKCCDTVECADCGRRWPGVREVWNQPPVYIPAPIYPQPSYPEWPKIWWSNTASVEMIGN